jgi:hypothetical protein
VEKTVGLGSGVEGFCEGIRAIILGLRSLYLALGRQTSRAFVRNCRVELLHLDQLLAETHGACLIWRLGKHVRRGSMGAAAQVGAGTWRAMENPSRDTVLAKAIHLRRAFRAWQERLTSIHLPVTRSLPDQPTSAQQDNVDYLFESESDTDAATIGLASRNYARGSHKQPPAHDADLVKERNAQEHVAGQKSWASRHTSSADMRESLEGSNLVLPLAIKDPAAYKERKIRAPQLSATGRIGFSSRASVKAAELPRQAHKGAQAPLPDHVKNQLAEQVLMLAPNAFLMGCSSNYCG